MPYNPCGRVVDFARREYVTKCRFFRDNPIEVDIQWYRAAEDAPSLPFPSAVMSLDWLDNGYDEPWAAVVGEVWNTPRPYSFHGAPLGLDYTHICGTEEDFAEGATFDPDEDVQYDDQGLPLCCEAPATPPMGFVVGMEVEVSVLPLPGNTCATAYLMTDGVPQEFEIPGPGTYWWVLPATVFTNWHITAEIVSGSFAAGSGTSNFIGPSCAELTDFGFWTLFGCETKIFAFPFDNKYSVLTVTAGSGVLRLTMGDGPCP